MKTLIISMSLLIALSISSCKRERVPEKVATTFNHQYSNASNVDWDVEENGEWEAEFEVDKKEMSAIFGQNGQWLETETEIEVSQLPEAVTLSLKNNFKDYTIKEVEYLESPKDKGYELSLNVDKQDIEVLMGKDGKILKQKMEEENEGDEESEEHYGESVEEGHEHHETFGFTNEFNMDQYTFSSTGKNTYFILEPGYQLILEGKDGEDSGRLEITILDKLEKVGNIETRIMEEKEMVNGELVEISRNYLAFCKETADIFYFGEEVDIYENGKIINHEGAWRADEPGNKAGILIPGRIFTAARYYQEIAPEKAMDRAEIISSSEELTTPAGHFSHCLKTKETSGLNPNEQEYKYYAPGVGLIREEDLFLVKYGQK